MKEEQLNDATLNALITLLDDSDAEVVAHVTEQLLAYGSPIIPRLEHAWEHLEDLQLQERVENIIHKIQFGITRDALHHWLESSRHDLLQGMIIIARYQFPDLSESRIRNHIESIRIDAWMEMNYYLTALEKVRILNHIFFRIHGFSGNTEQYNDPQNSFLNKVLESRKGNPISLCILYMIIAQRLNIPIYGVNLPQHFVLAYLDDTEAAEKLPIEQRKPLFYINAFNKGMVFGRKEIDQFLQLIKMPVDERFYMACSDFEIMIRVFNNLISSFEEEKKNDKVAELKELRQMISVYMSKRLGPGADTVE
ncbi:MAG: transglutaminase family protein [Bacteroidia bacterium]|jgi:regulator of sirC expression with transglutaminase-like and TPR domain